MGGSELFIWHFCLEVLSFHKTWVWFFNETCDSRLLQGSRGWVLKTTYCTLGVTGTQDKFLCVKPLPVVAVKPVPRL